MPTYSFTVGTIARTFEVLYSNDVRTAIGALSTTGITDAGLLAAASGALAQFTNALNVLNSIDDAVQSSVRSNGAGLMETIYGSAPIYNSFEVNGSGVLANENPNDPKGRPQKVMIEFNASVDRLWRDAIGPYLAEARNVTTRLPLSMSAFAAAIAAASPSSSLTAAEALMAAMSPINDALMGTGTADPFNLATRSRVLPFALPVLPNLQVT